MKSFADKFVIGFAISAGIVSASPVLIAAGAVAGTLCYFYKKHVEKSNIKAFKKIFLETPEGHKQLARITGERVETIETIAKAIN